MGESARDLEHFLVFARKADALPLPEGRRTPSQIHSHVQDFAIDHAHQFPLRMFDLV
jgi:hypothetical protein